MPTNVIEGAWDDEDGQAYVLGTIDVEAARTYYRETYLPETFGRNVDQTEVREGIELTEADPTLVWVDESEILEEEWAEIHREPAEGRVPVLIWS